jgi:hypothetical protein
MRTRQTAISLIIAGLAAHFSPVVAAEGPTKGRLEMKIVADSSDNGATDGDGTAFKIINHHEVVIKADLMFSHTDANDTIAEGYKDASAALDAKMKPLADSANKIKSSGLMGGGLMESIEKCSELEDETKIQACMMKAAAGLQGQMQEKCKKDPSLCAAIEDVQDEDNVSGVEAEARELQEAMTKFRFYVASACTVEASVDYRRHDQSASEAGGLFRADRSSKTNGLVRGTPSGGSEPCTLEMVVGPDNTVSFAFALSDQLKFPATHVNSPTTQDGNKVKLLGSEAFKNSFKVIKQKSGSPVSFSGDKNISVPAKTTKVASITTTSSSKAKITWSIKLN